MICGGWLGGEVVGEAKFADVGIKETMPLCVVGFSDVKLDRDMRFDVDGLEDGLCLRSHGGRVVGVTIN